MAVAFEGFHHDRVYEGWTYAFDSSRLYFGPLGLIFPAAPYVWTTCPYCGGDLPHCDNR